MNRLASFTKLAKQALLLAVLASLGLNGGTAEARSVAQGSSAGVNTITRTTAYRRTLGSVYCVHGQVAVKGWEKDLVKRNPGLNKFHWSPITAARPGTVVFTQRGTSRSMQQYHYAKPTVMSLDEVRLAQQKQQSMRADLNGRLQLSRTHLQEQVQEQLVSTYTNASVSQPYAYTYENSYRSKVNGRLISTR